MAAPREANLGELREALRASREREARAVQLMTEAEAELQRQSVHMMPLEEANRILGARNRDKISEFLSERGKQASVQLRFMVEDGGALGFVDTVLPSFCCALMELLKGLDAHRRVGTGGGGEAFQGAGITPACAR